MLLDITHFPLVWMAIGNTAIDTHDEGFAAFEALLSRAQPFVLLDAERARQQEHEHTHEEQKQLSLWMKRHKTALRTWVKGQVLIEPDTGRQQAARAFAPKFAAFWGYPLFVVPTREEAVQVAHRVLAQ
ncbi:hypothetical protein [Pseudomonas sp. microsymbiont 2]